MTRRGGGAEGAGGWGSGACAQASQGGWVVRPAKGWGARLRLSRGGGSSGVVGDKVGALGHIHWSMRHSHTRAISLNWETKRVGTMAQPPHTGGEMRALYLVFRRWELAAG